MTDFLQIILSAKVPYGEWYLNDVKTDPINFQYHLVSVSPATLIPHLMDRGWKYLNYIHPDLTGGSRGVFWFVKEDEALHQAAFRAGIVKLIDRTFDKEGRIDYMSGYHDALIDMLRFMDTGVLESDYA